MKMRLVMALALATTVLSVLPSQSAHAADPNIVFEGSGWGHGVGLSQYGAYGRAVAGHGYEEILAAYYPKTTLSSIDPDDPYLTEIFINVASDSVGTTLTVSDGPASPREGMVITRHDGADSEPQMTLDSGDSVVIVDTTPDVGEEHGCTFTFTVDDVESSWDVGSCDASIELLSGGSMPTQVVSATNCRTSNCTFGWGDSLMIVDNASDQRDVLDRTCGGTSSCPTWQGFDLVVGMTLDEYTRGIAEVPFSWPDDALKAQAVAARSYGASFAATGDHKDAGCFCDAKNDSSYQVYGGWIGAKYLWAEWDAAATATNSEILTHPDAPANGKVRAYYTSSNGGASESSADRWGTSLPYLSSVSDPYSLVDANPLAEWTEVFKASTVVDKVWGTSFDGTLTAVTVTERNTSGSAKTVEFTAVSGSDTYTSILSAGTVDSTFGLYSWYFDVDDTAIDPPPIEFADIAGTTHAANIEYLAALDAALPCDEEPYRFCPDERMRREDLAAFMVRVLDLPAVSTDYFTDDDGLPYEDDINSLAAAGITKGCNPPANTEFCPDDTVTRGQTAAFIVRAWNLKDNGGGGWFVDTTGSTFINDIDRLATAGITKGCNPPDNDEFCPNRLLSRGEMSSFLARAHRDLDLP